MAKKPKQKTAHPQNAGGVNVFRVESAQPYGWIVYLDGHAQTHFFASHALALIYAREWAKANPPSVHSHTVRNHLASIYSKLGVHSRLDLFMYAKERGLDRSAA